MTFTKNTQAGFSLVETAIVAILIGVLVIPFYTFILNIGNVGNVPDDKRLHDITYALSEHMRVVGTLPCPAQMDLGTSDDDYLEPNCADTTNVVGQNGGRVLIGAVPISALQVATNCSSDYDDILDDEAESVLHNAMELIKNKIDANTANEDEVQSSKAHKEGCISGEFAFDNNGSKIIYAVTQSATVLSDFNPYSNDAGEIRIVDGNGNDVTSNLQIYTLVSVGDDRVGGTDRAGVKSTCSTSAADGENCDDDSVFMDMAYSFADDLGNADHYDDIIEFSLAKLNLTENGHWSWSQSSAGGDKNIVFNPNTRIHIGKSEGGDDAAEDDKLVVNSGNLRVDGTGPNAGSITVQGGNAENSVNAPKFCYEPALSSACTP